MNPMHMHLILNHVPVIGTILCLLLLQWGAFRKDSEIQKTALAGLLLMALSVIPVYLSGEGSEEVMVPMAQLPQALIERHAQWAFWTFIIMEVLGAAALFTLYRFRLAPASCAPLIQGVLLIGLLCAALLGRTSWLGGQIRHSELQSDWKEFEISRRALP